MIYPFFYRALGFIAILLRWFNRINLPQTKASEPTSVLILEPFGMGDVISLEPLVRCLQANNHRVAICGLQQWRTLFSQSVHWIPSSLPWGARERREKYRLANYLSLSFWRCVGELRQWGRGQIGIDPRGDIRGVIALHLAGCRRVLTLSNYIGSDLTMPTAAADLVEFSPRLRRWELNTKFLEALGVPVAVRSPPRFQPLSVGSSSTFRFAIVPLAPWRGKLWEPVRWEELASRLRSRGWDIRGLCGPNQRRLAEAETNNVTPFTECTSIESWFKELSGVSIMLTLDTGPMHLADALQIPVIALFGSGLLPLWAPSGEYSRVVTHQNDPDFAFYPATDANIEYAQRLMRRITVVEVLNAVDDLIESLPKLT